MCGTLQIENDFSYNLKTTFVNIFAEILNFVSIGIFTTPILFPDRSSLIIGSGITFDTTTKYIASYNSVSQITNQSLLKNNKRLDNTRMDTLWASVF